MAQVIFYNALSYLKDSYRIKFRGEEIDRWKGGWGDLKNNGFTPLKRNCISKILLN